MSLLLVTGGAGFIGSRIVVAARAAGWDVRVIDALSPDVHTSQPARVDGVELVRADVTDSRALDACLAGVDVVSHQAAKVGMGVDVADAPDYVRANVLGTGELIAAMARARISRLVLASSMVVYGEGRYVGPRGDVRPGPRVDRDLRAGMFEPRDPVTGEILTPAFTHEDAPLDPRSLYAVSKLAQEHLVQVWAKETGGTAAVLRYHNVYGPGMPRDTPYAGVAAIFRSALERDEAPRVFEDGGQRRDFIHVDDIAAANMRAIEWTQSAPPAAARAFNIGSGVVSTILDVARQLARAHGGPQPVVTGGFRSGDVRHITASSARARSELGWEPTIALAEGMREFSTSPMRV
ncbi:NAD-dependent epimerase/dehydratase family protein [Microbacterium sulfonylureivorans]|uniref:NAD-dependent epimerase/dehydratase family protein n=1 Tax=Microbacterium sulfonylureivorans TaxID=2486854 RepID=UPI000FDB60C0|nr:NAD-dependent epimerase/dehydratase family protein [Microbacterium sulfonylureivorans]